MMQTVVVTEELSGERLDVALTHLLDGVSRSKLASWIKEGRVFVDAQPVTKPSVEVVAGAILGVHLPDEPPSVLLPDPSVPFQVVFEDEDLLVVDKPAGVVTHPGAGAESGTLVHGLLAHLGAPFLAVGHPNRPGIVHRLDKGTSGLMVIAKTVGAYHHLAKQFIPPRTISRRYQAVALLTSRFPPGGSGEVSLPLGRDPRDRKRMAVVKSGGKEAKTRYRLLRVLRESAVFELELDTGRTHQIRVHLAALGAPILGDPVYGPTQIPHPLVGAVKKIQRQALHACQLRFVHPRTGEEHAFSSSLPEDICQLITALTPREEGER